MKLTHLNWLASLHHIKLSDFFLNILIIIEHLIICFQNTGTNLNQRILADKRIHYSLEDKSALRLCKIEIRLKNFLCFHIDTGIFPSLRAGEIFNDIVKQGINTLSQNIGAHGHGNNSSVINIGTQGGSDLRFGEGFAAEISFHELFTCFSNRFHQGVTANLKVRLVVFGNLTFHDFLALPSVASLGNNIDIADKLLIFTDGQMEGSDFLAIKAGHVFHYLTIGSIINIHIGYKYHAGKLISVTQLPGFLCADFHTGLTGNNDDGGIRSADRFFHFTYKVKKTGSIQYIDLHTFPFNRDNRCAD